MARNPSQGKIWFPFYPGDYLADTMHLEGPQHGAYFLLLLAYWRNAGPLPATDDSLRIIARTQPGPWKAMRGTIAAFFEVSATHWTHPRMERELAHMRGNLASRQAVSKTANDARWGRKPKDHSGIHDGSMMDPSGTPHGSMSVPPSPSPSPSEEREGEVPVVPQGFPAVQQGHPQGPKGELPGFKTLGNHPPYDAVLAFVKKASSMTPEADVRAVWLAFEATAVDGIWFWGYKPVGDWRAAFLSRLGDEAKKSKRAPTPGGMAASFSSETPTEKLVPYEP